MAHFARHCPSVALGDIMDTRAMRAVRQARPDPYNELLCLLHRWREGPQAGAAARCDGVLLHGRLGCGKSTTARALCAELGLPLGVASAAAGDAPRRPEVSASVASCGASIAKVATTR